MSRVFVDTSGILALLVEDDSSHERAARAFSRLAAGDASLLTTSYVLIETYALLGRRFGRDAVAAFRDRFSPLLAVEWVDEPLHDAGLDLMLGKKGRRLSLVDAVSFAYMRREGVLAAFAFDAHFARHGFQAVR